MIYDSLKLLTMSDGGNWSSTARREKSIMLTGSWEGLAAVIHIIYPHSYVGVAALAGSRVLGGNDIFTEYERCYWAVALFL